ncbi:MAG: PrsW family intramembrane metalloprotease [Parcubacteria group bacterium]|nr:PrsW family intramembrane metalloprotease [Parcubacteria group bacterium]
MVTITIIISLLPSFTWLIFYLREDYRHPEPKRLLILAFLMGASMTVIAFGLQVAFENFSAAFGVIAYGPLYLFVMAGIEEIIKFSAAYLTVRKSRFFDEPVDAMIYMITAAMGFAAVENIFAISGAATTAAGQQAYLESVLETTSLRFVGATLLHTLSSGIVGYYWARGMAKARGAAFGLLTWGIIAATAVHAAFNYLILKFNRGELIYPTIFLILIAFFVLSDFEKLKRPEPESQI